MNAIIQPSDIHRMRRDLSSYLSHIPIARSKKQVSDFSTEKRRIRTGPRQGPYDPKYTPYLIEIMNNFSVSSIIKRTIFLKSVQIGATTAMENVICYYIGEDPADIMYISGTDQLLKRWVQEKLDPAIDAFGLRKKIKTISDAHNTSKQSGDTVFRKMFDGCSLDMTSARSSAGMASISKMVLCRDEIDRAPKELTTGEGNWLRVSEGRVQAFGDRQKIFDTSTPTTENSLVYQEFLTGDCRYFMVPCPHCGEYQALEFGDDYTKHGLKGEMNDCNRVTSVYYICKGCYEQIFEHKKTWLLDRGYWEATKVSEEENVRSYSINALYGPLGMTSWKDIFFKWQKAKGDRAEEAAFENLYKGMPYIDKSDNISSIAILDSLNSEVPENRYKHGDIPQGPIFLTAGIDVQEGSQSDKKNRGRLEMEILGHGRQYKTWSIDYLKFYGNTKDAYSGAWDKLYKYAVSTNLQFKDNIGAVLQIMAAFVDCGNGRYDYVVYEFCKRLKNFYAIKGFKDLKVQKGEKHESDQRSPIDKLKYRETIIGSENKLIEIATVHYKDKLFANLKKERQEGGVQVTGFCDFPIEYVDSENNELRYGQEYFDQLTSETKSSETGTYSAHGKRNEALDCRVYNLCAADYFLDMCVNRVREDMYKQGKGTVTKLQLQEKIRSPYILDKLEVALDRARRNFALEKLKKK